MSPTFSPVPFSDAKPGRGTAQTGFSSRYPDAAPAAGSLVLHSQVYFGLTNLDFAKKSGRITSAAAFVGEILGFRPLLTIHNGGTDTIQKVRGDHKLIPAMVEHFQKQAVDDGRGFYIVHARDKELAKELRKTLEKTTGRKCLGEYLIGASVTTNAGPTVFGVMVPVEKII